MSVLIATITDRFIALCADKWKTILKTGEKEETTKIEQWSSGIAVGGTGNAVLDELVISTVGDYVKEHGIENFTLEEIGDLFGQAYYAVKDENPEMPENIFAQFIVAGVLSGEKLGAAQIVIDNGIADMEIIEAMEVPATIIFGPGDISDDECNQLFQKAIRNSKNKNTYQKDLLEVAHRKAVRYISERSKFVGPKSDYIFITLPNMGK